MKTSTLRRFSIGLCCLGVVATITAGVIANKGYSKTDLFEPIEQESVPTILKEKTHIYIPELYAAKEPEAEQISVQDLMDQLVKYTIVQPTKDTCPIISQYDAQILMAISQSEAEVDGIEGMAAVMQVVLNRIKSDQFPNTIEQVVTQSTTIGDGRVIYQFSPVDIGTYFTVVPTVNAHLALAEVEKGNYQWLDALYFENAESSWQERNCTYVCTIGHHKFYR